MTSPRPIRTFGYGRMIIDVSPPHAARLAAASAQYVTALMLGCAARGLRGQTSTSTRASRSANDYNHPIVTSDRGAA